jgi:hypothetical protein
VGRGIGSKGVNGQGHRVIRSPGVKGSWKGHRIEGGEGVVGSGLGHRV